MERVLFFERLETTAGLLGFIPLCTILLSLVGLRWALVEVVADSGIPVFSALSHGTHLCVYKQLCVCQSGTRRNRRDTCH